MQPIRVVTQAVGANSPAWPPLATDKVRYVGEAIAACVAPTRAEAEDLAAGVAVDWPPQSYGRWLRLRSRAAFWPTRARLNWLKGSVISSPKLPPRPAGSRRWKGRRRPQGRRGRGVVEVS